MQMKTCMSIIWHMSMYIFVGDSVHVLNKERFLWAAKYGFKQRCRFFEEGKMYYIDIKLLWIRPMLSVRLNTKVCILRVCDTLSQQHKRQNRKGGGVYLLVFLRSGALHIYFNIWRQHIHVLLAFFFFACSFFCYNLIDEKMPMSLTPLLSKEYLIIGLV